MLHAYMRVCGRAKVRMGVCVQEKMNRVADLAVQEVGRRAGPELARPLGRGLGFGVQQPPKRGRRWVLHIQAPAAHVVLQRAQEITLGVDRSLHLRHKGVCEMQLC